MVWCSMKRFENYVSALDVLKGASEQDLENEFVIGGIINKFFLQFELGWKLFKRLLAYEGEAAAASGSPRDIIKVAYRYYDFIDEECWLTMLRDRNDATHRYDEQAARRLVDDILERFIPEFIHVEVALRERYGDMLLLPDDQVE